MVSFALFASEQGLQYAVSRRDRSQPMEGSLALHTGQLSEAIVRNRHDFSKQFDEAVAFVSPMQVHGNRVQVVTDMLNRGWETLDRTFEADALVTDLPGVVLTILTADCVPILLYDPVRKVIGAVHAGWRGTQARIVVKTVETMQTHCGSDPHNLIVGIGPAIGGCCYEVGAKVARQFAEYQDALIPKGNEKYQLDTKRINARQLIALGIPSSQIEISPVCTMCDHERFFSYRANQTDGRFMSGIMLKR